MFFKLEYKILNSFCFPKTIGRFLLIFKFENQLINLSLKRYFFFIQDCNWFFLKYSYLNVSGIFLTSKLSIKLFLH